jgi:hypothetical protein
MLAHTFKALPKLYVSVVLGRTDCATADKSKGGATSSKDKTPD